MAKVGVVLSGSGYLDGSEIHEAVLTLLYLDKQGAEIVCMAPDAEQVRVVNHNTGKAASEKRNVLVEAGRIARGKIRDVKNVSAKELDALIFPGGFGAALNLCTFAADGSSCSVNKDVEQLITAMHASRKPIGFICIAPAVGARVLGKQSPKLTIGNDAGTAAALGKMGAVHKECRVDDIVTDEKNKIVSTPAYMLGPSIAHVAKGIEKAVAKVIELI
ncbi:isoprenoid biosynthesis glyoxalase ElbB [bacterium]|nr:isoprenoid biosynthesis glyoxalase ElbB [bacterium]MCP5461977.1 isoprenoid biosynthesis glyoxalase ElbB [bacterium]